MWLAGCQSRTESRAEPPPPQRPPDHLPPFDHLPLDPPLRVTATFGEYRRSHFHAGVDFSTEQRVGRPVYAPVNGYVERVRASGAGFGRSLMLHAADGRTILFAHLDAFDEQIASFVAAVQESTGRYEQDLAPGEGRLPVRAGQRVAWSGESGAGPPHLHMEIRWGDVAYNPLRFGLTVADSTAPILRRVTLEPLDDTSYVSGSPGPRTFTLGTRADTVVVQGRARAWLEAADGVSDPWPRVAPYAETMDWDGAQVECRFDRIAWDAEMPAVEWIYDGTRRVAPGTALGLWIAPDYRPSMMTASRGRPGAGVLSVRSDDPPRVLTLRARDAADNLTERQLVIRPPRDGERGPLPSLRRRRARVSSRFELMPVDGPFVRIRYAGAMAGAREVALGLVGKDTALRPASFDGAAWVAIVRVPLGASAFVASGRTSAGTWEDRLSARLVAAGPLSEAVLTAQNATAAYRFLLPPQAFFVPTFLLVDSLQPEHGTLALASLGPAFEVQPSRLPLRRAARIEADLRGATAERGELYHLRGGSWIVAAPLGDSAAPSPGVVSGAVRALGRFAVFDDVAPPRVGPPRTVRISTAAPNRWALQVGVHEAGSGLDPEQTYFEVDGRRVPSEWDVERAILRWRPLKAPSSGAHEYRVVAIDRAGHETRGAGRFVVR